MTPFGRPVVPDEYSMVVPELSSAIRWAGWEQLGQLVGAVVQLPVGDDFAGAAHDEGRPVGNGFRVGSGIHGDSLPVMRIGLSGGAATVDRLIEQAMEAEADGFSSLWYA